jgi:hypothetical protein
MAMDTGRWNLTGTSSEHLINLSVSHNLQADCTLSASFRIPTAGITILPKIGDTVTYTANLSNYIYDAPPGVTPSTITFTLITAVVKSINIGADQYSITATTDFNNFVKAGSLKELDQLTTEELSALFDITETPTNDQYREFFESACKFKGSVYYSNSSTLGSMTRSVVDTVISGAKVPSVPMSFLTNANAISINKDDQETTNTSVPNVYDVVLNTRFTRVHSLVKDIELIVDSARPSGLRSVIAIPTGDSGTKDVYGTYDRPPKKSLISQAIESSGWKIITSSVTASYVTSDIYDVDTTTLIHAHDASDDLVSLSLSCSRQFEQNATLPIVCRIIDRKGIATAGKINYKRVDKTFSYDYAGGLSPTVTTSSYIDVIGNDYLDKMDSYILKAKYEMRGTGLSKLYGSYNENVILCNTVLSGSRSALYTQALPIAYASNIGEDVLIMGRTFSFDASSGSANLALQCKFVKTATSGTPPLPPGVTIPADVNFVSNSSPHNNLGSGFLAVGGPSSEWPDDTKWSFEHSVTLTHKYSYYVNGTTLQENVDPEVTLTNYYLHDVYKNPAYLTPPFSQTSEQCRIKYDKQKPVYTEAIILPQVTYTTIEL